MLKKMMELLRDPATQLVGLVLAILVSLGIYYAQRVKKRLEYEVTHNGRILTITEESKGALQLFYREQPVHNVRLIEIIINAGNEPITPTDFVSPLVLSLNQDAVVLSAAISKAEPIELSVEATYSSNQVKIAPLLLNQKDSFKIKLLVSSYESGPSLTGRITGITRIKEIRQSFKTETILLALAWVSILIGGWIAPDSPVRGSF